MAIEMVSVKCPDCGATLSVEGDRKTAFCSYCGSKIILHNDNEYTINVNDEAEVKYAETDQIVNLKKLEFAEKAAQDRKQVRKLKILISLALAAIGMVMIAVGNGLGKLTGNSDSGFYMLALLGFFPLMGAAYIWLLNKDNDDEDDNPYDDRLRVPSGISDYEKKSYQAIEAMFRGAGFTNVSSVGLGDLTVGILKKPGKVESITVNGKDVTSGGKKFPKDARVVISYHSQR